MVVGSLVVSMGAALPAWAREASAASTERAPRTTIGTTEAKLRDPAKTSGDDFGYDTSVSGDVAVVGAPERTSNGDGAAYIYVKGSRGWPTKPTTTLADPAATVGDYFGFAVAVSGKTVVVGALNTDDGTGAAYIYTEGHDGWPSSPTVTLADPLATEDDGFGQSVAVSGKTVVVGAFGSHDAERCRLHLLRGVRSLALDPDRRPERSGVGRELVRQRSCHDEGHARRRRRSHRRTGGCGLCLRRRSIDLAERTDRHAPRPDGDVR